MPNLDLCQELAPTEEELQWNNQTIETDKMMVFDPNFTLAEMGSGFRIFAFEDSLSTIPARRYKLPGPVANLMTVFLDARVLKPGEFDPRLKVMIKTETNLVQKSEILCLTFDRPDIPVTFSSALLGGLLWILQNTQKNVPLLVCSSSEFLLRVLVKERQKFENNILDPRFLLLRAVFAKVNERVARIQFKKVSNNHESYVWSDPSLTIQIDSEIDLMFECPGVFLSQGSQRFFTKTIRMLCPTPYRKSTFINLDRIRCSVEEISKYAPSDTGGMPYRLSVHKPQMLMNGG
jgi:hypothetical protein